MRKDYGIGKTAAAKQRITWRQAVQNKMDYSIKPEELARVWSWEDNYHGQYETQDDNEYAAQDDYEA